MGHDSLGRAVSSFAAEFGQCHMRPLRGWQFTPELPVHGRAEQSFPSMLTMRLWTGMFHFKK